MLRLQLPFSEEARSLLLDAVADPASETTDEGRWLFIHVVKPDLVQYAHEINMLIAGGKLDLPGGKTLHIGKLPKCPLESYDEGEVAILIGDATKARIERTAAYVLALNEAMGVKLVWKEAREWIYLRCLNKVSEIGDKEDQRVVDEEEKELYPKEEKAPSTLPPGTPPHVPLLESAVRGAAHRAPRVGKHR